MVILALYTQREQKRCSIVKDIIIPKRWMEIKSLSFELFILLKWIGMQK
jgi:hypothetical protein